MYNPYKLVSREPTAVRFCDECERSHTLTYVVTSQLDPHIHACPDCVYDLTGVNLNDPQERPADSV